MPRSLLLVVTLVGCTQTKGVEVDPRLLVPAAATVAFGFDLEPLRSSPLAEPLARALESEMKPAMVAIPACVTDLKDFRGTLATTTDSDERMFGVIESPGIGDEAVVQCIEREMRKASGESEPTVLFSTRGDVRVAPTEDGGHLVVLNKNTVLEVDRQWADAVFAAIETPASRTTTSPLATALQGIEPGTDAWLAMALTDGDRATFAEVPGADALSIVTAKADLTSGATLDVGMQLPDAAAAKRLHETLQGLVAEAKPALGIVGLPPTLLDGLTLTTADTRVDATLTVSAEALPAVVKAMGPLMAE